MIGTKYTTHSEITNVPAWTVTDIGKLTVPKGIYAVELRVEASEAITATEVEIGIQGHTWNVYHLNGAFNYAQSVTAVGEFDDDIIGHIFPAANLDNINIYVTLEAYRIA